jgi:hypothetical protein
MKELKITKNLFFKFHFASISVMGGSILPEKVKIVVPYWAAHLLLMQPGATKLRCSTSPE